MCVKTWGTSGKHLSAHQMKYDVLVVVIVDTVYNLHAHKFCLATNDGKIVLILL